MKKDKIIVIIGPTSSGKTSLSVDYCKEFGGSIVSVDSRQVYKYMDIGTGKFSVDSSLSVSKHDGLWQIDNVDIWGYDLVKPDKYYSAYDHAVYSLGKIGELSQRKETVLLVGGTGFYVDIITGRAKISSVLPDLPLRETLQKMSTKELRNYVTSLYPMKLAADEANNRNRLIRKIEIKESALSAGTPLPYPDDKEFMFIGLTADRSVLYARADMWVEKIWDNGLLEETQNLMDMGYENSPRMNGLVYDISRKYLKNELSEKEAISRIKFDVHAYIRRQQTYFRKNKEIHWFDISADSFKQNVYNLINEDTYDG